MTGFELLVGEPIEALPVTAALRRLRPKGTPPPSQTLKEALDALKQAEGAETIIDRLPTLGQPDPWGEVASFTVCETTGTAMGGTFVWNADFPGSLLTLFDAEANCYAYFAGAEDLGGLIPPQILSGQVWCHFAAPHPGYYLFLPSAQTYVDDYYGPDYYAAVECLIDNVSFGEFQMWPGHHFNQPLLANLAAAENPGVAHRFTIKQLTGGVFFWSLRVWSIPVAV
jgi:hypothetical protein